MSKKKSNSWKNAFLNWRKNPPVFLISILSLLIGGVIGYVTNDFVNLRENNRALLKEEFAQVERASGDVEMALEPFLAQARGVSAASDKDIANLRRALVALQSEVQDVRRRKPAISTAAQSFEASMISLVRAAQSFKDPFDGGKPFVETLGEFKLSQEKFEKSLIDEQQSAF